ncbi:MAG: replicative DNA helicase [Desulfobacterales bacterium]|nr:replicative DNA helicase [Desulfobacterales bacterium]MCP4163344.1 replicative DNA helicase [Deltaproteobacteria bacterium]
MYQKKPYNQNQVNSDPYLNKLPPQNIDAEESIISAILLDRNALIEIVDLLEPEDFYKKAHQEIFKAAVKLFSDNEPVDLVTLANKMKESGKLEEVGGATFLAQIVDTVPMAVNASHYAKIVKDKAILRVLIEKSSHITEKCFDDRGDVDEIIDFAETSIFKVSEKKTVKAFTTIKKLVNENFNTLEERQNNDSQFTGVPTGFSKLDEITSGLQPSDLIILAARPSMGKTAFALNIARNVAVDANVPVAVFSLEMANDQLSMRLLTSEARVNSARLKGEGFLNPDDWNRLTDSAEVLSNAPIFIDDSGYITAMEIRAKTRRLKMEHNLGLIIIDYLQLMKGSSSGGDRRDLEIAEISRSLKMLAKELQIPVIALSQLNRMLEQRNNKRPMLSDLRESGALEQDADIVAFIYRDEVYNKEDENNKGTAEIILAKHRNGEVGTVHLTFMGQFTRFEDRAFGDYPDQM